MSLPVSRWAKRQKTGSPSAKAVLISLAGYADDAGVCWPSQAAIADETELSERSVRRQLEALEEAGFIRREERRRDNNSRTTDLVMLLIDGAPARTECPGGPDTVSGGTGQGGRGVPDTVSAPTTFEPSVEPSEEPPQVPQAGDEPVDEVEVALVAWNDLARDCGLPVAKGLNEARRRSLRRRLKDAGLDGWSDALAAVRRSAFLRGQRPGKPFRADLDFVLQAKSFQRLIEGFYGDDAEDPAKPATPRSMDDEWRRRLRGWKASLWWEDLDWGPKPGRDGCKAPAAILAEFGLTAEIIPLHRQEHAA